jgi:hypothetical protein
MIIVNGVTNTFNNWAKAEPPDIEKLKPNCFGNHLASLSRIGGACAKKLIVSRDLRMDYFKRHCPPRAEMMARYTPPIPPCLRSCSIFVIEYIHDF